MAPVRPSELRSAAALFAVVGVLTAGCSVSTTAPAKPVPAHAAAPASPVARPPVGVIPVVDSTVGRSMPIEAYLFTAEQLEQVTAARDKLTVQCMQRFGLSYTPAPQPQPRQGGQAAHRYDVVDPADGYRVPQSAPAPAASTPPARLAPEEITVLAGDVPGNSKPITTFHGLPIPKGGCLGAADAKLTAQGGSMTDSPQAVDINFDDYQHSMTDDRLRAVFSQWSDCMKAKGYAYPTPNDATNDKRWKGTTTASAAEIATATADAQCRQQTNVIGTWFTVESAYEDQAIQANLGRLNQVKQGIAAVVGNAATVNAGGGL
ncbi:hypothetical protein P3T36_006297 [Kitasatospora sp. MAP12-15]|uniref:hypothetical protein n=1 Tax=unclassified Kitasatospora TaxID=2633591 RepID=UPI002474CCC7|nr:hypothetical protein [Kitasatospora sp. MAP12-44]MDH6108910.1 hypothetical protein [Kitasatospora sp. MAP12-44]